MNALYVTVSIPLLLVLAGFNHAHGLTTFGKSPNQGGQPHPDAQVKHCNNQATCALINGTTCLRSYCLCGDNTHPVNGKCKAQIKGPRHKCTTDAECVEGANCLPPKEKNKPGATAETISTNSEYKVCTCLEGLVETTSTCGASSISILPGLLILIAALSRNLN